MSHRVFERIPKVLYIDGEMDKRDLSPRLHFLNANEYFIIYPYRDLTNKDKRATLDNREYREFVKNRIIEEKFDIVFFDNLFSLFVGLELNGTQDWSEINQWFLDFRMNEISVVFIDHMGKDRNKGAIGTMSKIFNVDDIIYLTNPRGHNRDINMSCNLNMEYFRSGGSLEDRDRVLSDVNISLIDKEWIFDYANEGKNSVSKEDDLFYRALDIMIHDPNIRSVDLKSHLKVHQNHKIMNSLAEKFFIERPTNKKFLVTELGRQWFRAIRLKKESDTGENRGENPDE